MYVTVKPCHHINADIIRPFIYQAEYRKVFVFWSNVELVNYSNSEFYLSSRIYNIVSPSNII